MFPRLTTYVSSLLAMVLAYWLYALLVVPLVDPPRPPIEHETADNSSAPIRRPYDHLFPEGAWERDNPKIMITEQGALFIKDYQVLDDQQLEIKPCTLVFFAGGSRSAAPGANGTDSPADKTPPRPIVMQAPEGAVVTFDGGANFSRAKLGRLSKATLRGEITIHSPATGAGTNDELLITTRNVQIDERRVWTPHEVDMRFGPNTGSGRDLVINLNNGGPRLGKLRDGLQAVGIQSLELVHLDKLSLNVPSKGSPLGGTTFLSKINPRGFLPNMEREETTRLIPVEVTCAGSFLLDMEKQVASFENDVQVVCLRQEGAGDQLDCQKLEIGFRMPPPVVETKQDGIVTRKRTAPTFEPERILARGFPVILRVPSMNVSVQGTKLEYNMRTRRVHVDEQNGSAKIQDERASIEAPSIDYEMADGGRLGNLHASGPGHCVLRIPAENRTIESHWEEEIAVQPLEQNKVLSLRGDARLAVQGMGEISGRELHFYLLEVDEQTGKVVADADGNNVSKVRIVPDRLLGLGDVRLVSPQFTDRSEELRVWFRQPTDPGSGPMSFTANAINNTGSTATDPNRAPASRSRTRAPQQSFELSGGRVKVEIVLNKQPVIERATIEGDVTFAQTSGADNRDALRMTGSILEFEDGSSGNPKARLTGQPASVSAKGLTIQGDAIQLHQGDNFLWIDGAGEMKLPAGGRNVSQGITAADSPLTVTWRNGMQFDGSVASFMGDIRANGAMVLKTGQTMNVDASSGQLDVTLSQRIEFMNPRPSPDLTAQRFEFKGGVRMRNRGFDRGGQQESSDEYESPNLLLDQITGEIRSDGVGHVWTLRKGVGGIQRNPFVGQRPLPNVPALNVPAPNVGASNALTYLEADYLHGIRGDMLKKEIHFIGDVQTIYGTVGSWEQRLNPKAPVESNPEAIRLRCHDLVVREMGVMRNPHNPADTRPAFELEAIGNADVRGQQFHAQADHIGYAEAKDQLVIEGAARGSALLERFASPGAKPTSLRARKILFRPSTNEFDIQDGQAIRVEDLSQFQRGAKNGN